MQDLIEVQAFINELRKSHSLSALAEQLYGDESKRGMLSDVSRGVEANVSWAVLQDLRRRLGMSYKVRVIAEVPADTDVRVVSLRPYRHAGKWWRPCLPAELRKDHTAKDVEELIRAHWAPADDNEDPHRRLPSDENPKKHVASLLSEHEDGEGM